MRKRWGMPVPGGRRAVVVAGVGVGLVRATALALAARGDRVALPVRGREGLAAAADEVQRAGVRCEAGRKLTRLARR